MDDFLHNYEVSGGKMKPSLHGSGPEKLQSLRLAMGRDERVMVDDVEEEAKDDDIYAAIEGDEKRERWDVETVLSESRCAGNDQLFISFYKRPTRTLKTIRG
jgi:protein LTV1